MLGNMLADGACEPMIIVCPNMMTGQGNGMGFDAESMRKYDLVREDIENSIMPYMEQNYSVKTGRENTAITGFSLGGREALYTGITINNALPDTCISCCKRFSSRYISSGLPQCTHKE